MSKTKQSSKANQLAIPYTEQADILRLTATWKKVLNFFLHHDPSLINYSPRHPDYEALLDSLTSVVRLNNAIAQIFRDNNFTGAHILTLFTNRLVKDAHCRDVEKWIEEKNRPAKEGIKKAALDYHNDQPVAAIQKMQRESEKRIAEEKAKEFEESKRIAQAALEKVMEFEEWLPIYGKQKAAPESTPAPATAQDGTGKRFIFDNRFVLYNGRKLDLPKGQVFEIFKKLVKANGGVVLHKNLHDKSSEKEAAPDLREAIYQIRKALKKSKCPYNVKNKARKGYMLKKSN